MRFERNTAKLSSMVSYFIFHIKRVNEGYGYQLKRDFQVNQRAEGHQFVVQVNDKLTTFRARVKMTMLRFSVFFLFDF
jgi:hypothetical protein